MSDDVCAQTELRHCQRHNLMYWSACPRCVRESAQPEQPADVTTLRVTTLSKTIDLVLRRLTDLEAENRALRQHLADLERRHETLRRCVIGLEHGRITAQQAHNRLVEWVDVLGEGLLRLQEGRAH